MHNTSARTWRVLSTYTGMTYQVSYYTYQSRTWRVHVNCPISAQIGLVIINHVRECCYGFDYDDNNDKNNFYVWSSQVLKQKPTKHLEPLKRDLSFYYYFVFWRRLIFKIYPPIFTYASYRSHRARVKDETTQSKPLWCLWPAKNITLKVSCFKAQALRVTFRSFCAAFCHSAIR